jgi:hypothetical protein
MDHADAPDTQYETRIDEGVLSIEGARGRLEVGPVDRIVEEVGGETYTIQYDARSSSVYEWLDDESQTLDIDVREALSSYPIPASVVRALGEIPLDGTPDPTRTAYFADLVTSIWDAKGDMDVIEERTGGHVGRE